VGLNNKNCDLVATARLLRWYLGFANMEVSPDNSTYILRGSRKSQNLHKCPDAENRSANVTLSYTARKGQKRLGGQQQGLRPRHMSGTAGRESIHKDSETCSVFEHGELSKNVMITEYQRPEKSPQKII
jgi:hypothetical protein